MSDPRGHTYTEAWRHACEVRHVLRLPTREARREYLDGVERKRGHRAGQRLREDVAAAWAASRASTPDAGPPPLAVASEAAAAQRVHPAGVNALASPVACAPLLQPGDGSFPAVPRGGNSDPVNGVESKATAR